MLSKNDMKKILIIDDETAIRRAARLTLSAHGYIILEAASGAEALALASLEKPDLILSDVNMSGMDGMELLKRFRATPETAAIPVILMTGLPERTTARDSMAHGADDYLEKPFATEVLLSAVKARLERQEVLKLNAKANEARLLELLSVTQDLIAIADPRYGGLLYLNSAGRRMLGVDPADNVSDLHLHDFISSESGSTLAEKLARVQQEGIWVGESNVLGRDGRRIPVSSQIMSHVACNRMADYLSVVARDITECKRAEAELQKLHEELLETSRQAGMAEVATGVLHSVGNALTSINVASACIAQSLRNSNAATLSKVVALFRQHESDLGGFLASDPKGKQIPGYLSQLAERLITEQQLVLKELAQLQKSVEHVKSIISIQQNFAKRSGDVEVLKISDLVEDSLGVSGRALSSDILVSKEIDKDLFITGEKHKLLQILVNLVRNAKQACDGVDAKEKKLTIRARNDSEHVCITVSDTGVGIAPENLNHIFRHGFTTKKEGHGFGLHSSAILAQEMGGTLRVESEGLGKGATFTLELPRSVSVSVVPRSPPSIPPELRSW
jgi:PAS domain S-box-containing protein